MSVCNFKPRQLSWERSDMGTLAAAIRRLFKPAAAIPCKSLGPPFTTPDFYCALCTRLGEVKRPGQPIPDDMILDILDEIAVSSAWLRMAEPFRAVCKPSQARLARMKIAEVARLAQVAQTQDDRLRRVAMYIHLFGGRYAEYRSLGQFPGTKNPQISCRGLRSQGRHSGNRAHLGQR